MNVGSRKGGGNVKSLNEYKRRYLRAMNATKSMRDYLLAEIMTDMEIEYRIPLLEKHALESKNQVLRLYREISESRSI